MDVFKIANRNPASGEGPRLGIEKTGRKFGDGSVVDVTGSRRAGSAE